MERKWLGVENTVYQYHGDRDDPIISYKGVEWSEWEVYDAVESRINEEIQAGELPADMTVDKYLEDKTNHDIVTGLLEDWVYALQGPELSKVLYKQAASDYYENTEPHFEGAVAYDIANAVAGNAEKIKQLTTTITATLNETMESVFCENQDAFNIKANVYDMAELLENEIDISALKEIASEMDISIEQRYSVAIQGGRKGQDGPVYSNLQADELLAELENLDDGLFAIAIDSDGIVFKDTINEETLETLKNNLIEKGQYTELEKPTTEQSMPKKCSDPLDIDK